MADDQELTGIVQRMIDAGESEENIATVIQGYGSGPSAPAAPVAEPSGISAGTIAAPLAAKAVMGARPALASMSKAVASGTGRGAVNMIGRVVGGGAGAALGAGTGGGAFGGAALGGYVGGAAARQVQKPVRALAKVVANAAGTAKPLPIRAASGRMAAGALPTGRRLMNAFSEVAPKVATGLNIVGAGMMAKDLYDRFAPGIMNPKQPGEERAYYDPSRGDVSVEQQHADALDAQVREREQRAVNGHTAVGTDINLPNAHPEEVDLNALPADTRAQIIALLRQNR